MKKFMKVCGITALILLAVGMIIASTAGSVRGRTAVEDVVEAATGGRVHLNWGSWGWGNWGHFFDRIGDSLDDVDYDIDHDVNASMDFDRDYEILKGDVSKYCVGSDVRDLDIEVGGCRLTVKYSDDDSFYVETQNIGKFQCFVRGDTLYMKGITSVNRWNQLGNSKITLYVPSDYKYDEVDIELGAGVLEFNDLNAEQASLEVGAGEITIDNVRVNELEVNVGMGQITLNDMDVAQLKAEIGMGELQAQGALTKSADISCSMGNVEMVIDGKQEDFNYSLEGGMGNMELGSTSHAGLGFEKNIDNGADKNMTLECSMGNMSVKFTVR